MQRRSCAIRSESTITTRPARRIEATRRAMKTAALRVRRELGDHHAHEGLAVARLDLARRGDREARDAHAHALAAVALNAATLCAQRPVQQGREAVRALLGRGEADDPVGAKAAHGQVHDVGREVVALVHHDAAERVELTGSTARLASVSTIAITTS